MGLSETIMAAMIGAVATVSAAWFQLFTAWRARSKVETRAKRGLTARSILAVLALMTASAAGWFLYSELMKQRSGEDMRAMRQELKELTALIAQGRDRAAIQPAAAGAEPAMQVAQLPVPAGAAEEGVEPSVESIVYVPACPRSDIPGNPCAEADAQRVALCGTIPSYARVTAIELFAQPDAVQHPWDAHRAMFEQDMAARGSRASRSRTRRRTTSRPYA